MRKWHFWRQLNRCNFYAFLNGKWLISVNIWLKWQLFSHHWSNSCFQKCFRNSLSCSHCRIILDTLADFKESSFMNISFLNCNLDTCNELCLSVSAGKFSFRTAKKNKSKMKKHLYEKNLKPRITLLQTDIRRVWIWLTDFLLLELIFNINVFSFISVHMAF